VRGWRADGRDKLRRALEASSLCQPVSSTMNVDQLFATYDAALRDVADQLASSHVICRRPGRPTPWFDAECRALRPDCRRLERRFRHTQCLMDCQVWVQATRHRFLFSGVLLLSLLLINAKLNSWLTMLPLVIVYACCSLLLHKRNLMHCRVTA